MFDDFGTPVNMRYLHHNENFNDHGIQESFEVRKQICDLSTLD